MIDLSWQIELESGEVVSCSVFRINRIPSRDVIKERIQDDPDEKYRIEFSRMLTEVYQMAASQGVDVGDISLDLIWSAKPVQGQTYKADIEFRIAVRSIASTNENVCALDSTISKLIASTLSRLGYEYESENRDQLHSTVGIRHESCGAVIKRELVEVSNIPFIDAVYTFGTIPAACTSFNNLIEALSDSPGTVIHFQVMGTRYSDEESAVLTDYLQKATMASKGVATRGIGQISFLQADNISTTLQPYYDQRSGPLFTFNIAVRGNHDEVGRMVPQVIGMLNADPEHPVSFEMVDLEDSMFQSDELDISPWVVSEAIWKTRTRNPLVISGYAVSPVFRRLSRVLTVSEASEFFRLPLASGNLRVGLEVNESDMVARRFNAGVIDSADIRIGTLRSSGGSTIGVGLSDLTKHMFVCGTPGSGKSSFSIGLLDRLWNEHGIPFIVIEPAKNEYRALIDTIPDLQIFTPGKEFISPFVMNPFYPPDKVRLSSYRRTLKTAFSAAVSMTTPLDRIFEDAIINCYSDHGWSEHFTNADGGDVFNITEFIRSFHETFAEIGYVGDASNIGRAGEVRLRGLVNLFDYYGTVPVSDLLHKPTVIELAAVENAEEKSLFIALILLSILSYVNANYPGDGRLKNVVLLEEAHVLLDQDSKGNDEANPAAIAQNLVKRMLAEARAYGLGMVIADQSPRKVGLDIIALTDIKLSFRLVEGNDREIIADSTGMEEMQRSRLLKLRPGEAFLFFSRLDAPEEVVMPDYRELTGIRTAVMDDEIARRTTYWSEHLSLTCPYPECHLHGLCENGCDYECRSISKDVSRRLFNRRLRSTHDRELLKSVILDLPQLICAELGDYSDDRTVACVKVQFWRRVMYDSKYNLSPDFKDKMVQR